MKVACLLITHLRTKVEMRRHPNLKNIPAVERDLYWEPMIMGDIRRQVLWMAALRATHLDPVG